MVTAEYERPGGRDGQQLLVELAARTAAAAVDTGMWQAWLADPDTRRRRLDAGGPPARARPRYAWPPARLLGRGRLPGGVDPGAPRGMARPGRYPAPVTQSAGGRGAPPDPRGAVRAPCRDTAARTQAADYAVHAARAREMLIRALGGSRNVVTS